MRTTNTPFISSLFATTLLVCFTPACDDDESAGLEDPTAAIIPAGSIGELADIAAPSSPSFEQAYLAAARDVYPEQFADIDPDDPDAWLLVGSLLTPEQEQGGEFQETLDIYLGETELANTSNCPPWYDWWCIGMYTNPVVQHCSGWIKCVSKTRVDPLNCTSYPNPCVECWWTAECA